MTISKLNRDKLKTLIHYIAYRCVDNPKALGAIKLNKVLWYSDQWAYLNTGVPITGGKYLKKANGPVCSELMPVVSDLENDGKLAVRRINDAVSYLALTTPDMTGFDPNELRLVEDAIQLVCHQHSAKSISEKSHDHIWKLAELDEEIPMHAILAGRLHEITRDDVDWARAELKGATA